MKRQAGVYLTRENPTQEQASRDQAPSKPWLKQARRLRPAAATLPRRLRNGKNCIEDIDGDRFGIDKIDTKSEQERQEADSPEQARR